MSTVAWEKEGRCRCIPSPTETLIVLSAMELSGSSSSSMTYEAVRWMGIWYVRRRTSASTSTSSSVKSAANSSSLTTVSLGAGSAAETVDSASATSDGAGSTLGPPNPDPVGTSLSPSPAADAFLALSRRLRRLLTPVVLADDEASAAALLDGSESPKRAEGGARPDAARAASMPDNRELLDSRPETRGRR